MTIERRLQHAARELREVPIEVPPLGMRRPSPRRSRLQGVAAPLLFVAGGVLAMSVMQGRATEPIQTDIPAPTVAVDSTPEQVAVAPEPVPAPSMRAELELIAGIVQSNEPPPAAEAGSDAVAIEWAGGGPI